LNGNGLLEFKEFKKAMQDFKLDLEDKDIDNLFKSFDKNNDGNLDMYEFMDLVLGELSGDRLKVV
jgi:Ca2+-binding EF-hand superfamily protein